MVKYPAGTLLLDLKIEKGPGKTVSSQLQLALRGMILAGRLAPGERLPSSRTLARELGLSRTTTIDVYERLAAEGLITSKVGAGSFVSTAIGQDRPEEIEGPIEEEEQEPHRVPALSRALVKASALISERLPHRTRCFTTALPAFDAFPMALWSRLMAKHWRSGRDIVMGYGDPLGYWPLRRAIAAHLRANRGISCEAEQIFILCGAQEAFQLIGSLFIDPGDKVWFENPGAIGARNSLLASGAELVPLPIDRDGMVIEEGLRLAPDFRLAFVTPMHQQPLGVTMSLKRRFALLRAAERAGAFIVEDDYDGEFYYGKRPLPTLKSIDTKGCVIYVGTFSKTLFPAMRLGYLLAPEPLVEVFEKVVRSYLHGVASNPQVVLADFIEQGHFATHVRRMRKIYAERHQALLSAARKRLSGLLDVVPTNSGLHTIGHLTPGLCEAAVSEAAAEREITAAPIGAFSLTPLDHQGLVLGFSGTPPRDIRAGIDILGEAMESLCSGGAAEARGRAAVS